MTRRVLAVTVGVCIACGVQAEDKTFTENDSNFNDIDHWDPSGVPTSSDRIIIPAGRICHVDVNATVETFDVSGELIVDAQKTLTLVNHVCGLVPACGGLNSIVEGVVELKATSTLAITTRDHTISGDGQVLSADDNDPKITIASNLTLRNELGLWDPDNGLFGGIRGALSILGPGTILNDGNIEALPLDFNDPDE